MQVQNDSGARDQKRNTIQCGPDCWLPSYVRENGIELDLPTTSSKTSGNIPSVYTPLKEWQIRILRIEPGNFGDEIVTQLIIADKIYDSGIVLHKSQEKVRYTSLSYTWGSPGPMHQIICNGLKFPVTKNLYGALRRLRDHSPLYIWVDTICINQENLEEKAVQIQGMLSTYKKAFQVIAWLGEKSDHGNRAIDYVNEYPPTAVHKKECEVGLSQMQKDLLSLYSTQWARRTWIRQEVFAAAKLHVQCGDMRVSWRKFKMGVKHIVDAENRKMVSLNSLTCNWSPEKVEQQLKIIRSSDAF